jgi:hypothetical protein
LNKTVPYIIIGFIIVATVFLFIGSNRNKHRFDERITLRKKDKIPYGTYVAYENLKYIFPAADITLNRSEPVYSSLFASGKQGKLWLIISPQFLADESEMQKMIDFAKAGNQVFISTRKLSSTAMDLMNCKSSLSFEAIDAHDSLKLQLQKPPFAKNINAFYPGRRFDTYLYKIDSSITHILSHDDEGDPNFIQLKTGKGNIFIHLAPLAFSNFFLLHKNNISYYENVLSVVPANVNNIIWDEYYLTKLNFSEKKSANKNWLQVLFQYPSLKAGLLTAFAALFIYVLMEIRRKQRMIPVIEAPVNDSLNFVKTIGRLYYEKGDHLNLARKMSAYFLEHVRNRFQLPIKKPDEHFVKALHMKSGFDEKKLKEIADFILFTESAPAISENQLAHFHKQLELFYKTT